MESRAAVAWLLIALGFLDRQVQQQVLAAASAAAVDAVVSADQREKEAAAVSAHAQDVAIDVARGGGGETSASGGTCSLSLIHI